MRGFFLSVKSMGRSRSNWRGSVSLHAQLGPKYFEVVEEFGIAFSDAFSTCYGDWDVTTKAHQCCSHGDSVIAVRLNHDVCLVRLLVWMNRHGVGGFIAFDGHAEFGPFAFQHR